MDLLSSHTFYVQLIFDLPIIRMKFLVKVFPADSLKNDDGHTFF